MAPPAALFGVPVLSQSGYTALGAADTRFRSNQGLYEPTMMDANQLFFIVFRPRIAFVTPFTVFHAVK
jgi:hypothetical protein